MEKDKKPKHSAARIIANIVMCLAALLMLLLFVPVGIAVVAAIVLYNVLESKVSKARAAEQEQVKQEQEQLREDLSAAKEQAAALSSLQPVLDAQTEAAKIRADAQAEAAKAREDAQAEASRIRADAQAAASTLTLEAEAAASGMKEAAEAEAAAAKEAAAKQSQEAKAKLAGADAEVTRRLNSADVEAKRIIATAEAKAAEIAGDAYEIKKNVDELRQMELALKNTIHGYGDEWLKPTYSLLDELADEFSYTDAGAKLKDARASSARMVTAGTAATCDYVETNRRTTAIRFVIDAFNGKVDSILSKTKKDNYGKLEQQIRDAYNLVNYNGQAFRNARITPEYLDARLQELKWAVTVNELRAKEMEEQRRIRDQLREEAKAQREYERAQKQAAKEEAMLKKAMEKAKSMLAQANEAQKAKYEAQLQELQQKLTEAEERNQKALSMAQQTRHGNVYVISNVGSFGENVYKVGMTRRLEPLDRVRELGDASVPFSFDVHAIIESDDAPALEHTLHQELALMQMNKVNPRKEFFRVKLEDIRALVEKHGLSVKWTMAAEAAEYRETLAIEERMKNDPDAQARWQEFYARIAEEDAEEDDGEAL